MGRSDPALVATVLDAVDRANAEGPESVTVDGIVRPKEVVHAERMTYWLHVLDPDPTSAQRIAARAHHFRRWAVPRVDYPEGRAGYLRWRRDQKARHVREVGDLLVDLGADGDLVARVGVIVAKEGLGRDPQVQTHEDALCLVFLEQQFADLATQLGDERTVEVLRRTAAKMSPAALSLASGLPMSPQGRGLLERALAPDT